MKFLLSTAWKNPSDRNEAIELMNNWSDIGIEEAVPLLSGFFCLNDLFSHMSGDVNDQVIAYAHAGTFKFISPISSKLLTEYHCGSHAHAN